MNTTLFTRLAIGAGLSMLASVGLAQRNSFRYGGEPEVAPTRFAADLGAGLLYFGEQDAGAVALRLQGEWMPSAIGVGVELFAASSFGDMGELDGPGSMVRAFPYLTAALAGPSRDWRVGLRLGPEFLSLGAGDELYFEYEGWGAKLALDASFRLQGDEENGLLGRIGFGFGFGSGEAEAGAPGFQSAFVDDDTTSFDIEIGLAYELPAATIWVSLVHQDIAFDFFDDSVGFDGLLVGLTLRF